MKRLWNWLGRQAQRDRALFATRRTVREMGERLERWEILLRRLQRDLDRVRAGRTVVLGPDRALTLLASGDQLLVDPRDGGCGLNLIGSGRYEEDELRVFRRFLRAGVRMLDVGANYGLYSILAAPYLRAGGRITAFEPNPHLYRLLCSSVELNNHAGLIEPLRLGASDAAGVLRFQVDDTGPGGGRLLEPGAAADPRCRVHDVAVAPIDDRLGADEVVDLVKIDVEGHEERVLRGMRRTIARSPDIKIFMELLYPLFPSDDDFVRLHRLVTGELGLLVHRITPTGGIEPASLDALRGTTGNLVLSRQPLADMPDLTILPAQLNRAAEARLVEGAIAWTAPPGGDAPVRMVAHGPYVYLPRGRYRMVIDGTFEGRFRCRVLENFADILWEAEIGPGSGHVDDVILPMDAPRLEVGFWSELDAGRSLTLREIAFWPA